MTHKQTTQVPNFIFDTHLPQLTESELKILLVIIRQTVGWVNKTTGQRKRRDRISHSQFQKKAGLSKRIITKTIQSLSLKKLIQVTDFHGNELQQPQERKGKAHLYYAPLHPVHTETQISAHDIPKSVHKGEHNKTNSAKTTETKLRPRFVGHISQLIAEKAKYLKQFMTRNGLEKV